MISMARTNKNVPWWLVLIEGIAAAIVGLLLLTAPDITLFALVQVMGLFWLVGGLFRVVSAFLDGTLRGWKLLAGIVGILAGIAILEHPLWSAAAVSTTLVTLVGLAGALVGVISLVMAFQGGGWGIGLLGALSIIFGLFLALNPLISAAVLPIALGILGLAGGVGIIVVALRLR